MKRVVILTHNQWGFFSVFNIPVARCLNFRRHAPTLENTGQHSVHFGLNVALEWKTRILIGV